MFSTQETEWLRALVETMRQKGYQYYVAQTVTVNNNDSDVIVMFSESPIVGNGLYSYTVTDGVRYTLDSSGYSSYQGGGDRVVVDTFSGNLSVSDTEFVYTNADFVGTTIQPDIRQGGGVTYETGQTCLMLTAMLFLTVVFFRIFGGRR